MKFIKTLISNNNAKIIAQRIEEDVNAIVARAGHLPYHKRMEAIQRILKEMDDREKECYDEIAEINNAKELL